MEDIAKEVGVLQNKLRNSEATSDLIKEIAALQAKVQAKEATNDIRALQTKIEAIEGKLEAADRVNRIQTTQIEALQNKVKCTQLYVYQLYYNSYPLKPCFLYHPTLSLT